MYAASFPDTLRTLMIVPYFIVQNHFFKQVGNTAYVLNL